MNAPNQPFDRAAERAVLGSIFIDAGALFDLSGSLRPEDFYLESHRCIYRAMLALFDERIPVDSLTTLKKVRDLDLLEAAGGGPYIAELSASSPTAANVRHYAEIVREKSRQRMLLALGNEMVMAARADSDDVDALIAGFADRALDLSMGAHRAVGGGRKIIHDWDDLTASVVERAQEMTERRAAGEQVVISTGLPAMDAYFEFCVPKTTVALAARSQTGKTALALQLLREAAKQGVPGCIVELEMDADRIGARDATHRTGVGARNIRTGDLDAEKWRLLWDWRRETAGLPLHVLTPSRKSPDISRALRAGDAQMRRKTKGTGYGLIIVDTLLQIDEPGCRTRTEHASTAARSCSMWAKDYDAQVIHLDQVLREVDTVADAEGRKGVPTRSKIKYSSDIEDECDAILMCYREGLYDSRKPDAFEVIFEKSRDGRVGSAKLRWNGRYMRVEPLEKPSETPSMTNPLL